MDSTDRRAKRYSRSEDARSCTTKARVRLRASPVCARWCARWFYGGSASHAHVRWHALALSSTFPGPHWLAGVMGPPLYSAAGGGVASEKLGQTQGGRDGHHIITD